MARARTNALPILDIHADALEPILKVCEAHLPAETYVVVKAAFDSLTRLQQLVRRRGTTIAYLRGLIGIVSSEKTADLLKGGTLPDPVSGGAGTGSASDQAKGGDPARDADGARAPSSDDAPAPNPPTSAASAASSGGGATPGSESPAQTATGDTGGSAAKKPGHGRVPASAYSKAEHIAVPHQQLQPGDLCSLCERGKVYDLEDPAPMLRIFGQPPLVARCWDCQRLRCATCGHLYTAKAPQEAQGSKHDVSAVSMLAVLLYGYGLPMHRLEKLQGAFDTPVSASTQWDIVNAGADDLLPAYSEMFRRAAQGVVLHNDDTFMRLLDLMGKRRAAQLKAGELDDPERTGLFTSAIVSIAEDRRAITLYFTGRQHAGENLGDVLQRRAAELPRPTLMSDALARNVPRDHAVDEANCIPHGRRKVVREVDNFPAECRFFLEKLSVVFKIDKRCRLSGLTDQQRLEAHQHESAPVMEELRSWMSAQMEQKRIEPNSGLGKAFSYMLKRWEKFTLFLRKAGAPLDNNICERALKKAILHRKNSLFYRSLRGAFVGDVYMTLIHTAELHGENPFEYLTALLRHSKDVANRPADWMPWTYRETLTRLEPQPAPSASACSPNPHPQPAAAIAADVASDPLGERARAPAPAAIPPAEDPTPTSGPRCARRAETSPQIRDRPPQVEPPRRRATQPGHQANTGPPNAQILG